MKFIIKVVVLATIILVYMLFENEFTKVCIVNIKSNKIASGASFTILQISDVHNHHFININSLIGKIKRLKPDIIVITGDLINRKPTDFHNIYAFIDRIWDINNRIYFVYGNHERDNYNCKKFIQGLMERKVTILNNTNDIITKGNISINLCGVDDFSEGYSNLNRAFHNISHKNFTVLLSHEPDVVIKNKNICCDLILSGHTHGGQVRIPLLGAIVAPGQGYFPKYDKGLYGINNGPLLYIDSGVGTSVYPIRVFNRSQISVITISGQ